ncbi:MAG: winged helix-turn-helix domain-containing protein [Haloarculaceae archaeon]
MSERFVREADPEAAFSALADETRLEIVRALRRTDGGSATFSELRDAVGMRDSGRFNYHLDKLADRFVAKTDGEYQLTQAGKQVHGAVTSGVYTSRGTIEPIELDGPCRVCGGDQTLQYDGEVARVECEACSAGWAASVPPVVLAGCDRDEVAGVVDRYFRTRFRQVVDGFCTYCSGRMAANVGPVGAMDVGQSSAEETDRLTDRPVVQFDCPHCGATAGMDLSNALFFAHPAVVHFYYEHGVEVRDHALWDGDLDAGDGAIENRDPFRASVTFRAGDAELAVAVDGTFDVVNVDR